MNIQDLKSNTTWQEASNTINNNNNKISLAIATLENATLKNRGYFTSVEKLKEAVPNPTIGSKAYVGTSEPYAIYIVENGVWVDSGYTGGDEIVAKITTDRIADGAVTSEKISTSAFDSTLSVSGKIAPADIVGKKLTELENTFNDIGIRYERRVVSVGVDNSYVKSPDGTIATSTNFAISAPIQLLKGETISVNAYAYVTVGVISVCNQSGVVSSVKVVGLDTSNATLRTYMYTAENDCYVVVSGQKSHGRFPTNALIVTVSIDAINKSLSALNLSLEQAIEEISITGTRLTQTQENLSDLEVGVRGLFNKNGKRNVTQGVRFSTNAILTNLNIKKDSYFEIKVVASDGANILGYGIFANNYKLIYGRNDALNYTGEGVVLKAASDITNLGFTIAAESILTSGVVTLYLNESYDGSLTQKVNELTKDTSRIESELYVGGNELPIPNPRYHTPQVIQQNYIDDNISIVAQKPMIRSDVFVFNQGNLCVGSMSALDGLNYRSKNESFGDETCCVKFIPVSWREVQTADGQYDFSVILNKIQQAYNAKCRVALRVFPSVLGTTYGEYVHGGLTYRIGFPNYVAELMSNNGGQFVAHRYGGYDWLELDINLDVVYTEYAELLSAFGQWVNGTTIDGVSVKDLILYVECGFIGEYGEGRWENLQITTTSDKIVRYVQSCLDALPNTQVCIGSSIYTDDVHRVSSDYFIKAKELKNNVGYVGIYLDNVGSYNDGLYSGKKVNDEFTGLDLIEKYSARGDFFTGEFAMWLGQPGWGHQNCLWAFETFLRFKAPYFRVSNTRFYDTKHGFNIPIDEVSAYYLSNALAIVGFRYVMTKFKSQKTGTSLTLAFELSNIGLSACRFDLYKMYYRVYDLDLGTFTDVAIDYDLRNLNPANNIPCQYVVGAGQQFYATLSVANRCRVSLIIKDKLDLQNPLYLSNYGRNDDGSYTLYEDVA